MYNPTCERKYPLAPRSSVKTQRKLVNVMEPRKARLGPRAVCHISLQLMSKSNIALLPLLP